MGDWFQEGGKGNVIGKDLSTPAKVSKDGGDVDAITAATISSRAFCDALNKAYATYTASQSSNTATEAQPAAEEAKAEATAEPTEVAENEGGQDNE